jgi:hypothetical protein
MPDWSRRRALQAVAATGALALAGCSGESSFSSEVPRDRGDPVPPDEFEVTFVRDTDGEPLFTVDHDDREEDGGTPEVEQGTEYLTDDDDREELTFRSTEPATTLRRFVEGIDLGSRSVYLLQRLVGECYEARLVGVYRETDGVDADFCQSLRPADVECSADERDTVGVAISLPFEGDSFGGYGTGWSGGCEHRSTVASEGGDRA